MSEQPSPNAYWEGLSPKDLEDYDEALESLRLALEIGEEITKMDTISSIPLLRACYEPRKLEQAQRDADRLRPHHTQLWSVFHAKMPPRSAFNTPQMQDRRQESE